MTQPILKFKSQTSTTKQADVEVYADRVEWRKRGTPGLRSRGSEVMPIKSISSVTTERDGLAFTKVKLIASGNTIDFRVQKGKADKIRDEIMSLVLGTHPALTAPAPAPPSAPAPPAPAPPPPPQPQGPPPGFYPDPRGETAQRWWDGTTWTEHTQTS